MSLIHSKDTKPEVKVRKYLFKNGFKYRKSDSRYPGKPSIILTKYETAIFINTRRKRTPTGSLSASVWERKMEQLRLPTVYTNYYMIKYNTYYSF